MIAQGSVNHTGGKKAARQFTPGRGSRTNIERLDLTIPNHKIPHARHRAAQEDVIVDIDAGGPDGTALLRGFLGVVFQRDGRGFRVLDGGVGLIAAMRPVGRNQGRSCVCPACLLRRVAVGGVVNLGRTFQALHPLKGVWGYTEWVLVSVFGRVDCSDMYCRIIKHYGMVGSYFASRASTMNCIGEGCCQN